MQSIFIKEIEKEHYYMERNIITIDQSKCNGCGLCIPGCPEGAIQVIDGKARLVSDLMCDGLGACLGHCPVGAITVERREAGEYDEDRVMDGIVKQGTATIAAHLRHLKDHDQTDYLRQAQHYLAEHGIPMEQSAEAAPHAGCPGARSMAFTDDAAAAGTPRPDRPTRLTHWPVQMHLLSPAAPHFPGSDFVLAADCTAFALGDFHETFLRGKTLGIACPKLDDGKEMYGEKIRALIDEARIATLTVVIMEVPCCRGLLRIARTAAAGAKRKVPVTCVTVGVRGEIVREERL
jgi:ferredoxin